jgi:hypothetical protein
MPITPQLLGVKIDDNFRCTGLARDLSGESIAWHIQHLHNMVWVTLTGGLGSEAVWEFTDTNQDADVLNFTSQYFIEWQYPDLTRAGASLFIPKPSSYLIVPNISGYGMAPGGLVTGGGIDPTGIAEEWEIIRVRDGHKMQFGVGPIVTVSFGADTETDWYILRFKSAYGTWGVNGYFFPILNVYLEPYTYIDHCAFEVGPGIHPE